MVKENIRSTENVISMDMVVYLSIETPRGNLHQKACFHSVTATSEYTALLNHSTILILLQCHEQGLERIPLLGIEIHLE